MSHVPSLSALVLEKASQNPNRPRSKHPPIPKTTTMTTFAQVIQLNDQAVNQMLQGNINASNRNLRECLDLVKKCLVNLDNTNAQEADHQEGSSDYNKACRKTRRLSCSSSSCTSQYAIQALQDDEFFIYNRPIIFGHMVAAVPSAQLGRLLSAGIIFNMALLMHLQSRSGVKGALSKAEKLYSTVVRLVNDDECCRNMFAFELGIVALNNSLKACLELGEFEHAEQAAMSLQTMVTLLAEPQAFLESSAWDEIVANVFTLVVSSKQHGGVPTLIPCAPAA